MFVSRNVMQPPHPAAAVTQGRWLLWGWVQERRRPGGSYTYSGCLTLPRLLSAGPGGRLRQVCSLSFTHVHISFAVGFPGGLSV